jgi:hypothetical protein
MQFTKSQSGSVERVTGSFFVLTSPWHSGVANSEATGLRGVNLRGCYASWFRANNVLNLNLCPRGAGVAIGAAPAQSVTVPIPNINALASDSCQDMALGIVDTDIIVGVDPIINRWINVIMYGYTDRIACDPTTVFSNSDYFYSQEDGQVAAFGTTNRGLSIGVGRPTLRAARKLQGICTITLVTPADTDQIIFNLDGSAVSGPTGGNTAWSVPPGTDMAASTDATGTIPVPKGDACILGVRSDRTPVTPPETVTGGTGIPGIMEGFVCCMGISKFF